MIKYKALLALALSLIPSLCLAANTAPGEAEQSKPAESVRSAESAKPDLPNFHQTEPYLYRGGEPSDQGLVKLHEMGVGTIIDLRAPTAAALREKGEVERLGMKYINLPMDSRAPTGAQVAEFIRAVEAAKAAPDQKPAVFVHCQHGSDRTGCMVGIWRVTHDGYNYDQAYTEMRKYYFGPKFVKLSGAVRQYAESQSAKGKGEAKSVVQ